MTAAPIQGDHQEQLGFSALPKVTLTYGPGRGLNHQPPGYGTTALPQWTIEHSDSKHHNPIETFLSLSHQSGICDRVVSWKRSIV